MTGVANSRSQASHLFNCLDRGLADALVSTGIRVSTIPGQPPLQLPGPRIGRRSRRDVAADLVLELVVGGVGRSLVLGNTTCLRNGGEM